jgi:nitroreductase
MHDTSTDTVTMNAAQNRQQEFCVDPQFLNRWSPRAMTGEGIPRAELMQLFEAARWAPSSYNSQPWRFIFAEREGKYWLQFCNLLGDFNRTWAERAAVLVVIVSRTTFEKEGKPSVTHAFDCGAAWGYLALQGSLLGLIVHGMQGFDYVRARVDLSVPDGYEIHAMAAVGRPGRKSDLSPQMQEREIPSDRKPLAQTVCEGMFNFLQ